MDIKVKKIPDTWMKVRAYFILIVVLMLFAVLLVIHLFKVSVVQHDKYTEMANGYHFGTIDLPADRGSIYDANGTPLAWSANVYKIYIDADLYNTEIEEIQKKNKKLEKQGSKSAAKEIIDVDSLTTNFINYLSSKLEVDPDKIRQLIAKGGHYRVIKKQVEKPLAEEIISTCSDMGFRCVAKENDKKRYYTQNELAAQVIGFTDSDGNGQYGVENYYNDYLSGVDGREISAKDAHGNVMPYRRSETYDAVNGDNLYLTIDTTIQYYLEDSIKQMAKDFKVKKRACGIIMNPKTGAVLAMATTPGFDLNNPSEIFDEDTKEALAKLPSGAYKKAYSEARELQWKNKCVNETYYPGSVFKTFTGAAAIDEGAIDPKTFSYNCYGSIKVLDATLNCSHRSGHGLLDFQGAMTKSCNPAFIQIGLDLGIEKFNDYFENFGFTEKTGIDLPGEADSIHYKREQMSKVDLASSSFGQANQLTPIQVCTAYCAAVNGGYLLQPYVVGKITDSNGNTIKENTRTVKRQVISKETSDLMRKTLENVVEETPQSNAYIAGYKIGGKTGTSQKLGDYSLDDEARMQYTASYACFAPADDPEIMMLIIADEPDKSIGYYGYQVAVPASKRVLEKVLPYLGYYPKLSDSQYSSLNISVPSLKGMTIEQAQSTLSDANLDYEIIGAEDGKTITGQTPAAGTSMYQGGKIVLYTETSGDSQTVEVPSVEGKSLTEARNTLLQAGLNMFVNSGRNSNSDSDATYVVTGQTIEAGTVVNKGSIVIIDAKADKSLDDSDDDDESDDTGSASSSQSVDAD